MNWGKLFNSKRNKRIFYVLASIVVFVTTYMLVLPALTIDEDTALQDPGISNETLSEETVNELETVADPFTIEQDREEALNNTKTEETSTTDSSAVDSLDTQNTIQEETPLNTEEENTLSVSPDKDLISAVLEGDFYLFDYKSEEIDVFVKAPIDAFPEGTSMSVTPIASEDVIDQVNSALDSSKKAKKVQAVDITFYDKDGNEIEPATEIKVSLVSPMIKDSQNAEVVHIDNNGDSKLVTQSEENSNDDEIIFESKDFSTYVVVETEEISIDYLSADGNTYTITVDFDENAGIPEGSVLVVEELDTRSREYDSYFSQASKALDEKISSAKVFDISIMNGDEEIEPKGSVTVTIDYKDTYKVGDMNDVAAVHFGQDATEVLDVEYTNSDEKLETVSFSTDSFSIYAVVIIDKEEGEFVFEDEDYRVTVSYVKEANIPMGTELTVKEITPEEDQYWKLRKNTIKKINEGLVWEDTELTPDPRKGITDVVFFDISLNYNGEEIEPDVPLTVRIEYKNGGILVPDNEITQVIHFAKQDTELIEDVDVEFDENTNDGNKVAVSYKYEQSSFSVVGSYSTGEYIDINESNIVLPSAGILAAPVLRADGDSSISANKNITDNDNDGVYELTLDVTGQSESSSSTNVNKSNVVIVFDVSGSMDADTYSKYTGEGTSSGTYYGVINNYYSRVYWRNPGGGYRWQYNYNNRYYDYNGEVYFQESRLDAAKRALKELSNALLENNKNEIRDGVDLNDIIEISLIKFAFANEASGWNYYYNGTSKLIQDVNTVEEKNALNTVIDNLVAGGGTNWERALALAKDEADRYKASQPDENVSVIFITDGVPTSWGTTNTYGNEDRDVTHYAWNEADDDARRLIYANGSATGYTLFNIFAFGTDTQKYNSDGGRTDADYLRSLTNYAYSGSGTYANTTLSDAAKPYFFNASDTSALQDAFNAIINSISGNVGYGGVMVDDGVTIGVTSTSVTVDGSINTDKFRYSIKNGATTLATVHISGNTATFTIDGSEYTATGNTVTTNINGTIHTNTVFSVTVGDKTYKMSPATFDNNGKIQWDLAGIGIIENGYTYELSFDVWPNQLSYDIVADLNNGVKTLDEIKNDIIRSKGLEAWDQIEKALVSLGNGKYAVRTNYEQYVDYYTVDTKTNEQTGETTTEYTAQPRKELGPKDPVDLTSSTMNIRKLWEDSLDQDQFDELLWKDITRNAAGEIADQSPDNSLEYSVKLHVWKADTLDALNTQINNYAEAADGSYAQADANDYLAKTLGWIGSTYDWDDSLEVAPGTMIEISKAQEMGIDVTKHTQVTYGSKTYLVLESGHYYTVTEENIDRHFELNTIVYHPMLVDGVLSNVTFNADGTVEKIEPMSTVDATNTIKGGINVQKKVFDSKGNEITEVIVSDDTFKVKITMRNADGTPYENWDYRIYYGQNNPNGTWNETNQNYGRTDHNYGSAGNGGIIETDLYIGDVIRVINIPAGVTYTVEETEYDNTIYSIGANYTFPLTTGGIAKEFTTNASGISYMISKGESDNFVVDPDQKVQGNAASQAIVVNTVPTARIKLLKLGDSTTALDGVKFKIFYDEECTKPVTKDATGQAISGMNSNGIITTDSEGYADLGRLAGTYYFQEVATKDGYILLTAPVRVNVEKDGDGEKVTASSTQEGVIFNTPGWISKGEDGIWVVKVNNSSGIVLPHTGGNGTSKFYIFGSMLIAGSLMYEYSLRRNRKRKEVK